ncbi:MAG: hypothetical protein IKF56_07490 [Eggerthellaceae bacterium]|nr:hypothetical protein [Eggerthellaceae bacterium]
MDELEEHAVTNCYANESFASDGDLMKAGGKARKDCAAIMDHMGYKALDVIQSVSFKQNEPTKAAKVRRRLAAVHDWKEGCNSLKPGDVLVVQLPIRNHSLSVAKYLSRIRNLDVNVICLVHDLELFRLSKADAVIRMKQKELAKEETLLLQSATKIIVHNERMQLLIGSAFGSNVAEKCVLLGCFDYLIEGSFSSTNLSRTKDSGVVVAGNLSRIKAGYVYELPPGMNYELYGLNYNGQSSGSVHYNGAYPADELPSVMAGGFGLVWDGSSVDTCAGVYGEYLRINNPHKASLYLAAGMPVIIWGEAAMAKFIVDSGAGITVSSLTEIPTRIANMREADYSQMVKCARILSERIRSGYFLESALAAATEDV